MTEIETLAVLPAIEPGKARIKPEFIADLPPKDSSLLPTETEKEQKESSAVNSEPPPKKRRRGQNKNRPRTQRDQIEDCLCPSLVHEDGICMYGENCRFIHDIRKYMSAKPDCISDDCYMFKTHGKCDYSFACRYGSCHIKRMEDGSYINTQDSERLLSNPAPKIINTFPRELRIMLRKKQYAFPKSDPIFKKQGSNARKEVGKKNGANTTTATEAKVSENPELEIEKTGELKVVGSVTNKSETEDLTAGKKSNVSQNNSTIATEKENIPKVEETGSIHCSAETEEGAMTKVKDLLQNGCAAVTTGSVTNEDMIALNNGEKKTLKFDGKLFLAPLTTVGNLPFRVTCKSLGADITCGEMAMATCLLQGNVSEWALLKRHPCEEFFGVQICGAFPDSMTKCAELIERECEVDFIDINMGCPIDLVFHKGAGSALMQRTRKLFDIVSSMKSVMSIPLTCKMRTGVDSKRNTAHTILPKLRDYGVSLCTIHGRSRQARYTKLADWDYLEECSKVASPMPLFGNGDILSFEDYDRVMANKCISGVMIARGALIKPWIFTEIKERRHWDISSSERFEILKKYVNHGLMHWGSDARGVETTRRFLLEWLSFLHRYIPIGVLEQPPQKINEKPPIYVGRDDLETLMADRNCKAWVKISEMLLGKVPESFQFLPKHKANSYS